MEPSPQSQPPCTGRALYSLLVWVVLTCVMVWTMMTCGNDPDTSGTAVGTLIFDYWNASWQTFKYGGQHTENQIDNLNTMLILCHGLSAILGLVTIIIRPNYHGCLLNTYAAVSFSVFASLLVLYAIWFVWDWYKHQPSGFTPVVH